MALAASPRAPACAAAAPARSASQQAEGACSSLSGTGCSAPAGSPARRVELSCGMLRLWLQRLTGLAALPSVAEAARPAVLLAALARLRADASPDGSPLQAEASLRASLDADEQVFALAGAHTTAPWQPPGCAWRLYQQQLKWSVRWHVAPRCCYAALCAIGLRQCCKHVCAEPVVAPEHGQSLAHCSSPTSLMPSTIRTNLVCAGALVRAKVTCNGDLVAAVLTAEPAAVQELLRRLYTAYCLQRARSHAAWPAEPAGAAGAPPGAGGLAAPDAAGWPLPSLAGKCRRVTCCHSSFCVGQGSGVTCKAVLTRYTHSGMLCARYHDMTYALAADRARSRGRASGGAPGGAAAPPARP